VNGTDLNSSAHSQKYSQILGDHHTNYLPHNKTGSSAPSAHHNSFKTRSYNKENFYNQRSAAKNSLASKNSWQRSSNSAFRSSLKDSGSKSEENGNPDSDKQDFSTLIAAAEPIKFNEGEQSLKSINLGSREKSRMTVKFCNG
jgi:ribosomal protein S20